jgi:general secretion pathway protein J
VKRARFQSVGRRRQGARRCAAGFSLLEVLISLALLALIMAAMPGVLQLARRAWQSSEAIDRAGSQQIAMRFLRDRIAQAMPLTSKVTDGSAPVLFEGTVGRVMFVAPSIEGPPGTGLFVFDLSSTASTGGLTAVVLRWRPYRPALGNDDDAAITGERVVLEDVASFGLRYFGRTVANGERGWSGSWPRSNVLPELVELRLVSRDRLIANPLPIVIELLAQDVAAGR